MQYLATWTQNIIDIPLYCHCLKIINQYLKYGHKNLGYFIQIMQLYLHDGVLSVSV